MKTTTRHKHTSHNNYDLYADIERIKNAFADTAYDVKGKTSEALMDSVEGIKDKSSKLKNSVADYTAEKPFKTLGITLLVGIAIGYLLHK